MPAVRGVRPTATRSSSAAIRSPPDSSTSIPSPAVATRSTRAPVRTVFAAQRSGDLLAGEGLLASEDPVAALGQGDLRPQRRPGLGELGPDRPAPEDDHARRDPLRGGRVAVVPGLDRVEPLYRGHRRTGAVGDDDRAPRHQCGLVHHHSFFAVEPALAPEEHDPAFFQPGQLTRVVEVVDHLVAAGEDRLRVELASHRGRRAGHAPCLVEQLARSQQRLRGHACVVGALAADQVLLDDRDAEATVGEAPGADLSRGSRPDHDRVELGLAHAANLPASPTIDQDIARGRQASTWSIRANGCRSRLPEAS